MPSGNDTKLLMRNLPTVFRINKAKLFCYGSDIKSPEDSVVYLVHKVDYDKAVAALKRIGVCECDAQWSGKDEAEYRARGCPSCSCRPDWMVAKEALKELGEL